MDGGRAARRRPRGGRGIPALRQARTRVALTACGAALGLALAAYAAGLAGETAVLLAFGGLAATAVACGGALGGSAGVITLGLGGLVAEYGVAAGERGFELDTRAALWGSGLLLMAEVLFLAAEVRGAVLEGGDLVVRRLTTTFGVVIASVVVGAVLLGVAELPSAGGLALQLTGVAAVAAVLALVLSLARR